MVSVSSALYGNRNLGMEYFHLQRGNSASGWLFTRNDRRINVHTDLVRARLGEEAGWLCIVGVVEDRSQMSLGRVEVAGE